MTLRHLTTFFASLLIWCGFLEVGFGNSPEIFPLKKGLHYTYLYMDRYSYSNMGAFFSSRDSGTVEYLVLDSLIVGDSSVTWSVKERRNTLQWFHWYSDPETVYQVSDSMIFTLSESNTGYHELSSSSLIWKFPRIGRSLDSLRINRFASGPDTMLTHSYHCMFWLGPAFDSLSLLSDSGLYRVNWDRCVDFDDFFGERDSGAAILISRTLVSVEEFDSAPKSQLLLSNYPNPFNPLTTISYDIPKLSQIRLTFYDLTGRQVKELENTVRAPGHYTYEFDGSRLASGMYIVRLQANGIIRTSKMVLLK